MSTRALAGGRTGHKSTTGRVTPSKLRRTAVVAVDGALAVGTGVLAGVFGAGAASAAAPTPGWAGLQTPVPTGSDAPATNPHELIQTEACATAVSCVGAGSYADAGSNTRGLLTALKGGTWSSVEAPLPSDAKANPEPAFFDTACGSSGSCYAVGGYKNNSGGSGPPVNGLIETYSGGAWSATEAPVPSNAVGATSSHTWLKSVSCPAPGNCVAVGSYATGPSTTAGLIETLSGGQWTAMEAPQVSDANTSNEVALAGVSCPAPGSCVVDGIYRTNAGGTGLEVLTLSGATWTPSVAPLPADSATGSSERVGVSPFIEEFGRNISCTGTVCEIAGEYATAAGGTAGLLLHSTTSGGSWTASTAPVPSNAASGSSEDARLLTATCGFDGGCVAVGGYTDTASGTRPLVETISAGGAVTAQEAPQPSDAATGSSTDALLFGARCISSTDCTAVGVYTNNVGSGRPVGLIDTLSGTTWTARATPLPANAATGASAFSELFTVAGTPTGAFEAAGSYEDPGNSFGLLASFTPAQGYWTDASDGGIFSYGNAVFHGSMGGQHLNQPVVGMASTPDGGGYWEVASDGGIFSFGNAPFHGSAGSLRLNQPIVGMAATADGGGYWLVASDGGIFNYGDAGFYGSTGSLHLNKPVVGMAATPDGHGYWLVASDGGIFTYGDAQFYGSTGSIKLNKPVVGMATSASGLGYWLVASDGGIFTYGDAVFHGSSGSLVLNKPIVGMMSTFDGAGYWLVASDGGIFSYGNAGFQGSAGSLHLNAPMVGGTPT
jgi:hypothetical protein